MTKDEKIQSDARFISAVRLQESGDFEAAEKLYCELSEQYPETLELLLRTGSVLARRDKINDARRCLKRAVDLQPTDAMANYQLGMVEERCGDNAAAIESLQRAIELRPDYPRAHNALAEILLPYENYMGILKRFHQWLRPSNYVEIGVQSGASISLAEPPTVCLGIDPAPQINVSFAAPTRIFSETSDDFFGNHDLCKELGGQTVDLAFIDGLHNFDAALKDFINIEHYSSKDTVVLVHDCIPLDKWTSTRGRLTTFWSGDTWKIIPILKEYRPDLNVITIPAPPTGLTVISGLDSESGILAKQLDNIVEDYMSIDYEYLCPCKDDILNVIYDDWPSLQARIR